MPRCKQDEILNPKTNRCVKKSGKIGKALLEKVEKAPIVVKKKYPSWLYIPAYLREEQEAEEKRTPTPPPPPQPKKCSFRPILSQLLPPDDKLSEKIVNNVLRSLITDIVYIASNISRKKVLKKDDLQNILDVLIPYEVKNETEVKYIEKISEIVDTCLSKLISKSEIQLRIEKEAHKLLVQTINSLLISWTRSTKEPIIQKIKDIYDSIQEDDTFSHVIMKYI